MYKFQLNEKINKFYVKKDEDPYHQKYYYNYNPFDYFLGGDVVD